MAQTFDRAHVPVFDYNDHLGHEKQKQLLVRRSDKAAPGGKAPPGSVGATPRASLRPVLLIWAFTGRMCRVSTDHRQVYLGQCAE